MPSCSKQASRYGQWCLALSNPVGPEEPLQLPAGRSKAPACSDRRRRAALDGNGQAAEARQAQGARGGQEHQGLQG